jgi:UDP-N-acetylmuramoylalanine--D-glutamate ligase
MNWLASRVLIIGAARQGTALARYLVERGARVVLNDLRQPGDLRKARADLTGLPVEWVLGGHPLEVLEGVDLVCVSGGVPLELPIIQEAQKRGIPLSNDSQIFLERVLCPVIGITGSSGKSTTTALVGHLAGLAMGADQSGWLPESFTAPPPQVWVGGNIGRPLIADLEYINPQDLVVMELSSFQLELMTKVPQVAAVLNVTPNHLDRHRTMAAYRAAKARILDFQGLSDVAVLCREDQGAWDLVVHVKGSLQTFGRRRPEHDLPGTYLDQDSVRMVDDRGDRALFPLESVKLRGEHNLMNVLAAAALAVTAGLPESGLQEGVARFSGLPHRLEFVRQWGGADWFNDSIATAPERAMAAIRSFDQPLILLAGGRDKDLSWQDFGELVRQRVDHVVVFGEAAEKVLQAIGTPALNGHPASISRSESLQEAVAQAAGLARPGYVVLLAPGGTSFDEFRDFEDRGEQFKRWVNQLT